MVLEVDPETGDVTGHTQENVEVPGDAADADLNNPVVSEVKKIVDESLAEAEVVGSQSVGTVTADITPAHSGGERDDRLSESTLGNLVGQFLVEAVEERGGADIGFMNPGGLRDELRNDPSGENGNITLAEANGVLPFANTLVTLDLTGEQVRNVLEQQWQPADSSRPFLALGTSDNLTWTYDPTAAAGERITSVTIDGAPLDPAKTYTVATASFLAGGGDNFSEFSAGTNVRDTGLIDSEAWMAYLSERSATGIAPDVGRHAVAAKGLPGTVQAGEDVSFTLSDLDLTSLGAPTTGAVDVTLGGADLGTFTAVSGVDNTTFGPAGHHTPLDGHVVIDVTIPAGTPAGETALIVTTDTGTVITVPVTVA